MVVTAGYSDGSSKVVTNYTYSPTGALTVDDTSVTVSYTEVGVTVSATQGITVTVGTPISSLAVGSIVKVNENGSPVNYMIVQQGNPDTSMYDASCDGTWLLRQDIAENYAWGYTDNIYETNVINGYLNGTILNRFDNATQNLIKQVKIPYAYGGGGATIAQGSNGYPCRIFLLSGYEVGYTTSVSLYFPQDGYKLSYFDVGTGSIANNKRIAKLNGSAAPWWLRSPSTGSSNSAWSILSNGTCYYYGCSNSYGIRPCFIIPSTTLVDTDNNIVTS